MYMSHHSRLFLVRLFIEHFVLSHYITLNLVSRISGDDQLTICQFQDVEPYTYFIDVLQCISQHPAQRAIELTPRIWKLCLQTNRYVLSLPIPRSSFSIGFVS